MSRLNDVQEDELSIQTVSQDLDDLERCLASGSNIDPRDLRTCLKRHDKILDGFHLRATEAWQDDQQPLPAWLHPEQTPSSLQHEEVKEPGSAAV